MSSNNEASFIVKEFFTRKMMVKCGGSFPPLDVFLADCFIEINSEISSVQNEEMKIADLKARVGRRG